jgi:uncharacterized protein
VEARPFPDTQKRVTNRPVVAADFAAFITSDAFPCVGAKSALALGRVWTFEAGDIFCPAHDAALRDALMEFADATPPGAAISSFACLFTPTRAPLSEMQFERALWTRLQALHDLDAADGVGWAEDASPDPTSNEFSMSVGGAAFFVIGLHPGASRAARRFSRPAMIFNSHAQFEALRADGRYGAMQTIIRQRELRRNRSINPMLSDFGRGREAAQYSGRAVEAAWRCPLNIKT